MWADTNNGLGNGICMSPEIEMIELGHNMKVTFRKTQQLAAVLLTDCLCFREASRGKVG